MSPEALRRRMAHGNIYPPERVDAALANYFRPGNLAALRELALLWVADRVEESLQALHGGPRHRRRRGRRASGSSWPSPGLRAATSSSAGPLASPGACAAGWSACTSCRPTGCETRAGPTLAEQRRLLERARRHLPGDRRRPRACGARRLRPLREGHPGGRSAPAERSRWHELLHGSVVGTRSCGRAEGFDVHVIAQRDEDEVAVLGDDPSVAAAPASPASSAPDRGVDPRRGRAARCSPRRWRRPGGTPSRWRPTCSCSWSPRSASRSSEGCSSAPSPRSLASLLVNWFFVAADPHLHDRRPRERRRHRDLRRRRDRRQRPGRPHPPAAASEALQARAEAGALARTSGILIGEPNPLPELLDQLRTTFALRAVSLLSNRDDGWVMDASAGDDPPTDPFDGDSLGPRRGRHERRRPAGRPAVGRRSAGAAHVPVEPGAGPAVPPAAGGGRGRGAPGRGRPAAHRAAPGGQPRPPHPAGVDQGVGHQPPPIRRGAGTPSSAERSRRPSTRRPTASTTSSVTSST